MPFEHPAIIRIPYKNTFGTPFVEFTGQLWKVKDKNLYFRFIKHGRSTAYSIITNKGVMTNVGFAQLSTTTGKQFTYRVHAIEHLLYLLENINVS